eukprot:3648476-Pyramimonas_sp.AAC.1
MCVCVCLLSVRGAPAQRSARGGRGARQGNPHRPASCRCSACSSLPVLCLLSRLIQPLHLSPPSSFS